MTFPVRYIGVANNWKYALRKAKVLDTLDGNFPAVCHCDSIEMAVKIADAMNTAEGYVTQAVFEASVA